MTVGKAIFTLLLSDTDLRGIVSNRIFPEVAQQDAVLPYVVYNISSNEPSDTKREPSKMDTAQIEVNLYSTSYTECIDMATHVRAALDRVTGTYAGVNVQSIQYLSEIIDFDEAQRTYNITADYDVRISRTNFEIAQGSPITGVKLGALSDVDTTGVTDGQVIAYDAAAQEWQPADGTGGVTELGQLDDVQFGQGGPESGDLLKYDGSEWTNDSLHKSEIGLGNVDNTSDVNKPVSTATQTELNAKANSADFSNVDNTSDADKPVSTATQTALNAKADTSAVPTDLNDLSDVSIVGTPAGNQALIYDTTAGAFKSQVSYTNRFEDEVETGLQIPTIYAERGYSVKSEGDGTFIDPSSDTPAAGKVIQRKIYHKTGFISDSDVIGDYTLIHTFADDTAYADTVAVFDAFEDGATYGVPPFTLFQTWEEVTAAPAFTGLLNETYGSGAEAAYSTRRLNGNVTDCMVIRRASDSTTTTIGFDGSGNISEADIISFCTGTTCTVYQWLDQSENDNHATAASTGEEPTIYTGGAIVKENGKPAVENVLSGAQGLNIPSFTINLSDFTCTLVSKFYSDSSTEGYPIRISVEGGSLDYRYKQFSIARDKFYLGTSTVQSYNNAVSFTASTNLQLHTITPTNGSVDGASVGTFGTAGEDLNLNPTFNYLTSGDIGRDRGTHANTNEVIIWTTDKSGTDQTSIESNIGDYFTQNTPLLDTYTGAAAAYSLRLLRTAYTGDAVEVYNGSSYADIGFNVFGELDTVALAAHCGSNDGFVSKWYDQSGNTNDAAQTATGQMPKIYDGATAAVVEENGKPAFDVITNQGGLSLNYSRTVTAQSHFVVAEVQQVNSARLITQFLAGSTFDYNPGGSYIPMIYYNGLGSYAGGYKSMQAASAGQHGVSAIHTGSSVTSYVDGNAATSESHTLSSGNFASYHIKAGWSQVMTGTVQEVILFDSDESSNRAGIETNLNDFYSIY